MQPHECKAHTRTGHEIPEREWSYTSTCSLTSALYFGGWSTPHSARLPPGKTRYPLYRRLGGPKDHFGRVRKTSPPQRFDPQTVQIVASRYIDWAIAAHNAAKFSKETRSYTHRHGVTWTLATVWLPELLALYVWKGKWKVAGQAMKANRRTGGPVPLIPNLRNYMALYIIIFINCNWVVTRWRWLFYMYTKHEIGY
jgi:hypothetical protein